MSTTNPETKQKPYSYDETPYDCYPMRQTHPAHFKAIASLFKMKAPELKNARILELGCANGGNIIPLAFQYPQAVITGIDLSINQVTDGNETINNLELKNITLHHMSIDDITKDFGTFDYIICHGVYSWVPEKTCNNIFKICRDNLASNGIAYISYNTLPGWNITKSFRDMMLYHVNGIDAPEQKAKQARMLLDFIAENLGHNSPYFKFLETEIELISARSDNYLLHDHLGPINEPVFFHQFIEKAREYDLSYLADTPLSMMYPYNLPPQAAKKLNEINDIIRTNQYMDFLRNERFRCTLLGHKNTIETRITRSINVNDIEKFYISCAQDIEILFKDSDDNQKIKVNFKNNKLTITSGSPVPKAAFAVLSSRWEKPIAYAKLLDQVSEKTGIDDREHIRHILNEKLNMTRLLLAGIIEIHIEEARYTIQRTETPHAGDYARYKAATGSHVVSQRHDPISVNMFQRMMLLYMDGEHKHSEIIDRLLGHIDKGELQIMSPDNKPVTDPEEIRTWCKNEYFRNIDYFMANALLI